MPNNPTRKVPSSAIVVLKSASFRRSRRDNILLCTRRGDCQLEFGCSDWTQKRSSTVSVVAGVDFGTLSVRISIFDKERGKLGSATAEYPLHSSPSDPHLKRSEERRVGKECRY